MKNIPQKIYLNFNMTPQEVTETKEQDFHEATKTWEITWSEECLSEHDPEYVLKDAFVKKAVEHIDGLIEFLNECGHQLKKERIIEGFKKYMDG